MIVDGKLRRVISKHTPPAPTRAQRITYSKGDTERKDYGKLMPDDLRPLIAKDVEEYLKAGGKITVIPPALKHL